MAPLALLGFVEIKMETGCATPSQGDFLKPSGKEDGRAAVSKKQDKYCFATVEKSRKVSDDTFVRAWLLNKPQMLPSDTSSESNSFGNLHHTKAVRLLNQAEIPLNTGREKMNWTRMRWRCHIHFYAHLASVHGDDGRRQKAFDLLKKEFESDCKAIRVPKDCLEDGSGHNKCKECLFDIRLIKLLWGPYKMKWTDYRRQQGSKGGSKASTRRKDGHESRYPYIPPEVVQRSDGVLFKASMAYMKMKLNQKTEAGVDVRSAKANLSVCCEECRHDMECELVVLTQQISGRSRDDRDSNLNFNPQVDDPILQSVYHCCMAWKTMPHDVSTNLERLTSEVARKHLEQLEKANNSVAESEGLNNGNMDALLLSMAILGRRISANGKLGNPPPVDGVLKYCKKVEELHDEKKAAASLHCERMKLIMALAISYPQNCQEEVKLFDYGQTSYKFCIDEDVLKSDYITMWTRTCLVLNKNSEIISCLDRAISRIELLQDENDKPSILDLRDRIYLHTTIACCYAHQKRWKESAENNWKALRILSMAISQCGNDEKRMLTTRIIQNTFDYLKKFYKSKARSRLPSPRDIINHLEVLLREFVYKDNVLHDGAKELFEREIKPFFQRNSAWPQDKFDPRTHFEHPCRELAMKMVDFKFETDWLGRDILQLFNERLVRLQRLQSQLTVIDMKDFLLDARHSRQRLKDFLGRESVIYEDRTVCYCEEEVEYSDPNAPAYVYKNSFQIWTSSAPGRDFPIYPSRIWFRSMETEGCEENSAVLKDCWIPSYSRANTRDQAARN